MKKQTVRNVLSLAVVAGATLVSSVSFAQNLAASVTAVHSNIASIPNLISGACYIIGAGLVGAGLLKLKTYSENPANAPIGQGLGRIVIGTTLLASPAMTGWIQSTVAASGTAVTSTALTNIQ